MPDLSKELLFILLKFLEEEKLKDTMHEFEQESGIFLNQKYLEDLVMAGKFDQAEHYLLGFTKIDENIHSVKMFFEIRVQKYIEALKMKDQSKAVQILVKDLKQFKEYSPKLYKDITQLLTFDNLSEVTMSERTLKWLDIKKLIENNPVIRPKLTFPAIPTSRFRTLMNQSFHWQHYACKNPRPNPDIITLYVDHTSESPNERKNTPLTKNPLMGTIQTEGDFPPIATHIPFQLGVTPTATTLTGWMENLNPPIPHDVVPASGSSFVPPLNAGPIPPSQPSNSRMEYPFAHSERLMKRFRAGQDDVPSQPGVTPTATDTSLTGWMVNLNPHVPHDAVHTGGYALVPPPNAGPIQPSQPRNSRLEYQFADSQRVMKHFRAGLDAEIGNLRPNNPSNMYSKIDPPKTVVRSLDQCSNVVTMDFHSKQQTVLLVGTDVGDIGIWEVGSSEELAHRSFKVWDASNCVKDAQVVFSKESAVSVNQSIWSPNGDLFGVAFSKNIVHIYSYIVKGELRQQLQIHAHIGGVNDIAFVHPNEKLCVVTCGDDMTIKVWDAETGHKQYTFEGHTAPVYSVCPNRKENIQYILSTSFDGKIKAWLFGHSGFQIDYDAPGHGCTTMAYSNDGSRLFSCGTSKEGESYLVEWNESDRAIKRMYSGLQSRSSELAKFDTTKNRFLAVGDDYQIKFWDMDNINTFSTTSAEGCLPARPHLGFNKEGSLLAVTTRNNGVKILANADGLQFLGMLENRGAPPASMITKDPLLNPICAANEIGPVPITLENSERNLPEVLMNSVDSNRMADGGQRLPGQVADKRKNRKFFEVTDPVQCRSIRLLDPLSNGQIARLLYTYSGCSLLALDSNATHRLWKWQCNNSNPSGKATTNVQPQLWQPPSGFLMTNDTSDGVSEEVVPCIALSDNDAYLISASGGQVSVFRMNTFEVMAKFIAPPPAATFIAFNPLDNNIIAIGMEDSTIQIFSVQLNEVLGIYSFSPSV